MKNHIELPSIRDRDLRHVLGHFALEAELEEGHLLCASCSRPISWDNIGALRVVGQDLVIYCDFSECLTSASHMQE